MYVCKKLCTYVYYTMKSILQDFEDKITHKEPEISDVLGAQDYPDVNQVKQRFIDIWENFKTKVNTLAVITQLQNSIHMQYHSI